MADLLQTTRTFWDTHSCGAHGGYAAVKAQRYAMEPWLPAVLERIARQHQSILEVGCGQGIDSIQLCAAMASHGQYLGLDYSPASVARAVAHAQQHQLQVTPRYRVGNAEALDVPDASVEVVYSMGVLHHTANERAAVREIHRVLQPGGTAYVFLYRRFAPKVAVAKSLRVLQRGLDVVLGTDRCIYQWLARRASFHPWVGTMLHECFGVPYMKWYSRKDIAELFESFDDVSLTPMGSNLGRLVHSSGPSRFGYFWGIVARK